MKKLICIALSAAMVAVLLLGCGAKKPETTKVELTLDEIMTGLTTKVPVEFAGGAMPLDLSDTSEEGLWAIQRSTGLENANDITEAMVFEPMIGSIAYSLVLVRVAENSDPEAVAAAMQSGIDPRKWICVGADDVMLAGCGDVVMLIMTDSGTGLSSQPYVDAFGEILGAEPTFVLK